MFELLNKAKVVWSMLSGKPLEVVRQENGKVYTIKYIPSHKEFVVRENDQIVLRAKLKI